VLRGWLSEQQATLGPESTSTDITAWTKNSEAYHAYIKGRFFWNKRTQAGTTKGIEHFEQTYLSISVRRQDNFGEASKGREVLQRGQ
jgi:hypothetical protein